MFFSRCKSVCLWLSVFLVISCSSGGGEEQVSSAAKPTSSKSSSSQVSSSSTAPSDSSESSELSASSESVVFSESSESSASSVGPAPLPSISVSAGNDIEVAENQAVMLTAVVLGKQSETLRYVWRQVAGETVQLQQSELLVLTFQAPQTETEIFLEFIFEGLLNGTAVVSDRVQVKVIPINSLPTVQTLQPITVSDSELVRQELVASDDDGSIVLVEWKQITGQPVVLNSNTGTILEFTTPLLDAVELFEFEYTVFDNEGAMVFGIQQVIVEPEMRVEFSFPIKHTAFTGSVINAFGYVANWQGDVDQMSVQVDAGGTPVQARVDENGKWSATLEIVSEDNVATFSALATDEMGQQVRTAFDINNELSLGNPGALQCNQQLAQCVVYDNRWGAFIEIDLNSGKKKFLSLDKDFESSHRGNGYIETYYDEAKPKFVYLSNATVRNIGLHDRSPLFELSLNSYNIVAQPMIDANRNVLYLARRNTLDDGRYTSIFQVDLATGEAIAVLDPITKNDPIISFEKVFWDEIKQRFIVYDSEKRVVAIYPKIEGVTELDVLASEDIGEGDEAILNTRIPIFTFHSQTNSLFLADVNDTKLAKIDLATGNRAYLDTDLEGRVFNVGDIDVGEDGKTIYLLTRTAPSLYAVDIETSTARKVVNPKLPTHTNLGVSWMDIGYEQTKQTLLFKGRSSSRTDSRSPIWSYALGSGVVNEVHEPFRMYGVGLGNNGLDWFYSLPGEFDINKLNLNTGAVSDISSLFVGQGPRLSSPPRYIIQPKNQTDLYFFDEDLKKFVSVNTDTGDRTIIAPESSFVYERVSKFDFDLDNRKMYFFAKEASMDGPAIFSIDLSSGETSLVDQTGDFRTYDLPEVVAFDGDFKNLYYVDLPGGSVGNGYVSKYQLESQTHSVVSSKSIGIGPTIYSFNILFYDLKHKRIVAGSSSDMFIVNPNTGDRVLLQRLGE